MDFKCHTFKGHVEGTLRNVGLFCFELDGKVFIMHFYYSSAKRVQHKGQYQTLSTGHDIPNSQGSNGQGN